MRPAHARRRRAAPCSARCERLAKPQKAETFISADSRCRMKTRRRRTCRKPESENPAPARRGRVPGEFNEKSRSKSETILSIEFDPRISQPRMIATIQDICSQPDIYFLKNIIHKLEINQFASRSLALLRIQGKIDIRLPRTFVIITQATHTTNFHPGALFERIITGFHHTPDHRPGFRYCLPGVISIHSTIDSIYAAAKHNLRSKPTAARRRHPRCKIPTKDEAISRHKISILNDAKFINSAACHPIDKLLRFRPKYTTYRQSTLNCGRVYFKNRNMKINIHVKSFFIDRLG